MFPLLTFAAGLLTGAAGIRLLKSVKTPEKLREATSAGVEAVSGQFGRAETGLRNATVSSLSAIERSSASLRAKLEAEPAAVAVEPEAPAAAKPKRSRAKPKAAPAESKAEAKPAAKPRRARKAPPAPEGGSEPTP